MAPSQRTRLDLQAFHGLRTAADKKDRLTRNQMVSAQLFNKRYGPI